ncbi:hypothetical protein CCMSSC00406_0005283 [Pleurotus cornucopiae]|uniref:Uncharacterized protein n=1 Tax=Pleurotus cornucopiae TaxID=5321 RepID=A0ACB7II44_PLECO|nr:hypothetical protein CCMSSC00406_0005283 [Pleurotus cornucopiae]
MSPVHDFVLPPPRQVHGLDLKWNYQFPPMDGSLTMSELYDFHYENNPEHPVFKYANRAGDIVTLAYDKVVPAIHNAGRYVANAVGVQLGGGSQDKPVVAIVASSDTITYFTTVVGMLRAEIIVFPVSPRNSPPAVAHLLRRTQPTNVLVSVETPIKELVNEALELLRSENEKKIPVVAPMPVFEQLYTDEPFQPLPPRTRDLDSTRIIVHSSGSTSFPKPIIINDRTNFQTAMVPQFASHDLCGKVIACHAVAMFHAIGLNFIAWMTGAGFVMGTFEPTSPAIGPNPDNVFQGTVDVGADYGFGVPAFLEAWSHDPVKVEHFKSIKGIWFGGGPLTHAAGDFLASQGIALYSLYGQSEIGVIGNIIGENPGMDWEYVSINPHCAAEFVPHGDGTFELITVKKPTHHFFIVNTKFRGQDAYATSDLLKPHPTRKGWWKIHGRADDQIMLSTGEKTNPGPLESILCRHPLVDHAVFFGRGRFQNGVIIQPVPQSQFDPNDEEKLIEFRNAIWSKVEEMNAMAPSHSRLFKEMIIVTHPSKPFPLTPKGAPKRAVIISMYEEEIDAVYAAVEESANRGQSDEPVDWSDLNDVKSFVKRVTDSVLKKPANEEDDFFECGCDSLQATWIRNAILGALRRLTPPVTAVSPNVVYDHPKIPALAQHLHALVNGSAENLAANLAGTTLHDIENCLTRYTASFPQRISAVNGHANGVADGDIVFVTGTTGSLGSAVLAKLVHDSAVKKVYAFNRGAKVPLLDRQKSALRSRGYNEAIATSPKVVLVEGELSALGLAWRVDFNLSFHSYEASIGGLRTLVDIALSVPQGRPPAKVTFISSVGVFRNLSTSQKAKPIVEEPLPDPTVSLGQGYSESKWTAEHVLYAAARHCKEFSPVIVRVGQISGSPNGNWNTTDWVPVIFKSSATLGCLPEYKGICSWIPLDLCARAIVEMRNAQPAKLVVHLVHPRPVSAKRVFHYAGDQFHPPLPLIPYTEWVKKLEDIANISAATSAGGASAGERSKQKELLDRVPGLKLLEFFQGGAKVEEEMEGEHGEAMGIPLLEMTQALAASKALQETGDLAVSDAKLWVEYWRSVGYI